MSRLQGQVRVRAIYRGFGCIRGLFMGEPTHWVRWGTVAAIMIILGFEFDSLLGLLVSLSFGAPCIFVLSFFLQVMWSKDSGC